MQSDCLHESVAINTLPWHRKEIVEVSENETAVACGDGPMLTLRNLEDTLKILPAVPLAEEYFHSRFAELVRPFVRNVDAFRCVHGQPRLQFLF